MADDRRRYYTPAKIEYWLREWPTLEELCLNPGAAGHLLGPERSGPSPTTPRTGARQKGRHGDPMIWINVKADLLRAFRELPPGTPGKHSVALRTQGYSFGEIARLKRMRKADLLAAHKAAVQRMFEFLEGVPEEERGTQSEAIYRHAVADWV